MTGPRSAEERISLWLEQEAVGLLPDRVLDATFEETRDLRQASRSGWRPFSMSRPIPALIAVGAAAIVIVVGAILLRPAPSSQVGGGRHPDTLTPSVFTSPQFGYTVDVPTSWDVTPAAKPWPAGQRIETDPTTVDAFRATGSPIDASARIAAQPARDGTTATSWLTEWEGMREVLGGHCFGTATEWMPATVAGFPAWQVKWRCDNAVDERSSYDEYTFLVGTMGYVITGTPSMLDPILQSFRVPSTAVQPSVPMAFQAGQLEPGDYTTTAFEPTITFRLGTGWLGLGMDDRSSINIDRPNGAGTLAMARVSEIVDPVTHIRTPAPDDLMGWLVAHPSFAWNFEPTPATLAGITGKMIEGEVTADAEMFPLPGGTMRVEEGWRVRYFVLPLDGPDLTIIVFGVSDADFAETLAQAASVLDTLAIAR